MVDLRGSWAGLPTFHGPKRAQESRGPWNKWEGPGEAGGHPFMPRKPLDSEHGSVRQVEQATPSDRRRHRRLHSAASRGTQRRSAARWCTRPCGGSRRVGTLALSQASTGPNEERRTFDERGDEARTEPRHLHPTLLPTRCGRSQCRRCICRKGHTREASGQHALTCSTSDLREPSSTLV